MIADTELRMTATASKHSDLPPIGLKLYLEGPNNNAKIHRCYRAKAEGKESCGKLNKYLYSINTM